MIKHISSEFKLKHFEQLYTVTFTCDRHGRSSEVSIDKQGLPFQWIDNSDEKYRPCTEHAELIVNELVGTRKAGA